VAINEVNQEDCQTITIDEAINVLYNYRVYPVDVRDKATYLGIEALKRIEEQSSNPKFGRYKPLPGETEE